MTSESGDKKAKNRLGRKAMESLMRKILDKHTAGVFSDEYWAPLSSIMHDFNLESIDISLTNSKYFTLKRSEFSYDGMPDGKEWIFAIPYKKGGWHLRLVASFGPSPVRNPMSVYDLVYTLCWDAKL